MIRCQAFQDTSLPVTQCWNDYGHDGDHRWLSDRDWITWPQHINLVDRLRRKVNL